MKIKMIKKIYGKSGQALISLLVFVIIGVTVITVSAILIYNNVFSASAAEQGVYAYYMAESGAEEALLRLIRNPNYTGTVSVDDIPTENGSVNVTVNSGTIISTGQYNNSIRKIQVETLYNNNILTVSSWKEIE